MSGTESKVSKADFVQPGNSVGGMVCVAVPSVVDHHETAGSIGEVISMKTVVKIIVLGSRNTIAVVPLGPVVVTAGHKRRCVKIMESEDLLRFNAVVELIHSLVVGEV